VLLNLVQHGNQVTLAMRAEAHGFDVTHQRRGQRGLGLVISACINSETSYDTSRELGLIMRVQEFVRAVAVGTAQELLVKRDHGRIIVRPADGFSEIDRVERLGAQAREFRIEHMYPGGDKAGRRPPRNRPGRP